MGTSESGAPHLRRVLGRWDLMWLCVVAITNTNLVPVIASSGPITIWLWILALAFFFWPQGVAVIELAYRYPGEGGIYIWAKEAFGDFHGFMCGWCYWSTNMFYIPTLLFYLAGISAFASGKQGATLADNRPFFFVLTVGLLWLTTVVNIRGLGIGKWVNNLGGIGTMTASLALIGLCVFTVLRHGSNLSLRSLAPSGLDWSMVSSFGVMCFAVVGLELGSVMGDEIREPRRTVPQAVLWGGIISGFLYLAATSSLLLAVPRQEIGLVQGVLQAIDRMTRGTPAVWLATFVGVVLVAAIAGSTSAWLGGSARILFVSGLDRYLPRVFGRIHPKYETPHVALLAQAILSSVIIVMSFVGATVKEAYVTLLDLAVVLQMISYLYLYAVLLWVGLRGDMRQGWYSRRRILIAAVSGLVTASIGMIVAFVPSHQITSIWLFEVKMVVSCALFLGLAAFLFWYYSRRKKSERELVVVTSESGG